MEMLMFFDYNDRKKGEITMTGMTKLINPFSRKYTETEAETDGKWGLVLCGGGTKGAYQVGAWKAITELKLPIKGITGTSIGALNAALILQDDYQKMVNIYETIKITDILPVSDKVDPNKDIFDPANLLELSKEFIGQRGLDNSALKNYITNCLDIKKIYDNPIDLGIVTFDMKSLEPLQLYKKDIPEDKLVDYLTASANFPIFKAKQIDGKSFMDGGIYDNMPINLLVNAGYTRIIVLDVNGIGYVRRIENPGNAYVKIIQCSEDPGGTFEFNKDRIHRNMTMGYLDTLRAFHKLFGYFYYFRRPAYNDLMLNFDLKTIYGLETAAKIYGIERMKIYKAEEFLDAIEAAYAETDSRYRRSAKLIGNTDILKILRSSANMTPESVSMCVDLLQERPSFPISNPVAKAFPELIAAASAITELRNYRRL